MLDMNKKVDENTCKCVLSLTDGMRRSVQTGLGLSEHRQGEGEKVMTGEVQGKASVPAWSLLQKDQMLKAHESTERGVALPSPDMEREISHKGAMFIDDRTAHVGRSGSNENAEDDFATCMANVQRGAQ